MKAWTIIALACCIAVASSYETLPEEDLSLTSSARDGHMDMARNSHIDVAHQERRSQRSHSKSRSGHMAHQERRSQRSHSKSAPKHTSMYSTRNKKEAKPRVRSRHAAHSTDMAQTGWWHRKPRCTSKGNMVKWGGGRKRIGRHLYGQRMLYQWKCNTYHYVRWWWAVLQHNKYDHHLHGRLQWRWTNSYRRIGVHRYRYQSLYRNYQGHWKRIGGKWRLNRRNAYYRKPRYFWGRLKRQGRHQYRLRCLKRWTGSHWVNIRCKWHLHRRNAYRHRLAGQTQWRWGRYKRVGRHLYRHRSLWKRDFNGRWKRIRSYWHKVAHNKYAHRLAGRTKWVWGRRYKRIGYHRYRERKLFKRDFNGRWKYVRRVWRLVGRNHYRPKQGRYRRGKRLCARLYEHSNYRGRVFNVYKDTRYLGWFNDRLSSMKVYNCHIMLYPHKNYRGGFKEFGPGSYNYYKIRRTVGNDRVSSLRADLHPTHHGGKGWSHGRRL